MTAWIRTIFFLLFCGASHLEALGDKCGDALSDLGGQRLSLVITDEVPPNRREKIVEFSKWKKPDFEQHAGNVIDFTYLARDWKDVTVPSQQLLLLAHLHPAERALVSLLNEKKHGKFARRAAVGEFTAHYKQYTDLVDRARKGGYLKAKIDPRQAAMENASVVREQGVEVGAWRIVLKDGTVLTAIHTSSRSNHIEDQDTNRAILSVLNKQPGLRLDQIATIQYFHTHPGNGGPLSPGDIGVMREVKEFFNKKGAYFPVHIYAIVEVDNEPFVFHHGIR